MDPQIVQSTNTNVPRGLRQRLEEAFVILWRAHPPHQQMQIVRWAERRKVSRSKKRVRAVMSLLIQAWRRTIDR